MAVFVGERPLLPVPFQMMTSQLPPHLRRRHLNQPLSHRKWILPSVICFNPMSNLVQKSEEIQKEGESKMNRTNCLPLTFGEEPKKSSTGTHYGMRWDNQVQLVPCEASSSTNKEVTLPLLLTEKVKSKRVMFQKEKFEGKKKLLIGTLLGKKKKMKRLMKNGLPV
eukprot:Lithocolla_globosa_v1_NODE_328_length_4454_cov_14.999318.p2 type:complete len:166 gc:universal NODE_328_length_4454_cov_14.999318:1826-2323(+)